MFILVSYQAGVDHQTSASLTGIRLFETLLPAALHLLLAITITFCKLDNRLLNRMSGELASKI